jgi:hypothetical protein
MAAPTTQSAQQPARSFEVPFPDVTLRAEADGATVRLHRGELGFHSRVFLQALTLTDSPPDELPLPGKTASDLALLTAFMYPRRSRDEGFTCGCIARFAELGREYDMPELLAAVDDWLAAHAAELVLPTDGVAIPQNAGRVAQFLKLLQLAHDFKFSRFFELGIASWSQSAERRAVLEKGANEARKLDSKVLFRLLSAVCEQEPRCRHCHSRNINHGYCSNCGRNPAY